MEESVYSKLPKLKVELSLTTLVASVLIFIFAFVLPISLIQNNNNTTSQPTGAQVAGISTEKSEQESRTIILPIVNQEVKLEGQSGVLIIIGLGLLGLSVLIIGFLTFEHLKKH